LWFHLPVDCAILDVGEGGVWVPSHRISVGFEDRQESVSTFGEGDFPMRPRQRWFDVSLALFTTLSFGFGIVSNANAQSGQRHSEELRQILRGIDTVPTRTQLMQVTDDPVEALFAFVVDPSVSLYERRRATSLLALFESPVAESTLMLLATIAPNPRIRWVAIYSYCRAWAQRKPSHVLTFAKLMLSSPSSNVREAVVFGLRFVTQPEAHQLLLDGMARERNARVLAVYKRVLRSRNARLGPAKNTSARSRTK